MMPSPPSPVCSRPKNSPAQKNSPRMAPRAVGRPQATQGFNPPTPVGLRLVGAALAGHRAEDGKNRPAVNRAAGLKGPTGPMSQTAPEANHEPMVKRARIDVRISTAAGAAERVVGRQGHVLGDLAVIGVAIFDPTFHAGP